MTDPLPLRNAAGLSAGDKFACAPFPGTDNELDLHLLVGLARGLTGRGDRPLNLRLLKGAALESPSIFFGGILIDTRTHLSD